MMKHNFGSNLWCYLIFLTLIVGIYHPVYRFDFLMGWDDQIFVTNFYTEDGFQASNLLAIFTEFYRGQYAPLNQLHYTALYHVIGYHQGAFHIASLLIHFLNTVLVYHFSVAVWRRLGLQTTSKRSIQRLGFLTAVLFAVLPINVEPVAWVSASKVLIYAFFYLLSLLLYSHYLNGGKSVYYYAVLVAYLLSFFGKEQAVSLPLALFLLDWLWNRSLWKKDVWLEKIPAFILSVLFGLITIESQGFQDTARSFYPWYQRLPLALYTLVEYFTKCIFPINLSYLYPFPFQNGDAVPRWMWLHVIFIPFIAWYLFLLKDRAVRFGILFFLIHVALVLNITSLARHSVIADRYTYVASIGICFLVVYGFQHVYAHRKKVALFAGMVYLIALIGYAHVYVHAWKNAYSVKERLKKTIESREDFEELKKIRQN